MERANVILSLHNLKMGRIRVRHTNPVYTFTSHFTTVRYRTFAPSTMVYL